MATYSLTCTTTSYSLTGQTANLEYNRLFDCGTRDFYLSGRTADFFYNRRANLTQVAYNIAGYALTLSLDRQMLYQGAYLIAGPDVASLEYNRKPSLASGAYTLSGSTANLVHAIALLSLDSGTYSLAGQTVSLDYLLYYTLLCDYGMLTLGGSDLLSAYYEHLLSSGVAQFTITTHAN